MAKKKPSLGRDVFSDKPGQTKSDAVRKMLRDPAGPGAAKARHVEVMVKLTPSDIKHLDVLAKQLQETGKGKFTRSELIRVAIALLSAGDF